jgi:intracellular sulfur oxidation DsrE/DsrF family protein
MGKMKQGLGWMSAGQAVFAGFVLLMSCAGFALGEMDEALFPEQDEINRLLLGDKPEGVLFLVMEQDEEALKWVLPRILHYSAQLRAAWQGVPIAVLSHGDEMMGLLTEYAPLYPQMHAQVRRLINEFDASFHVCGTYAAMSDIAPSEFPDYVDVAPFGPAEIQNYRLMEFNVVSVELTW